MGKKKPTLLVLCSRNTDADALVEPLTGMHIEIVFAKGMSDAIVRLRDRPFDMILAESQIDGKSGVSFLAEARKRLPNMLRVLYETEPIAISPYALINDVAPHAIFNEVIDEKRIAELMAPRQAAATAEMSGSADDDEDPKRKVMSEAEKFEAIMKMSVEFNAMMEDPEIKLPVMPELAMKVQKLMSDSNCTFETVADLVTLEQGMSARILQVSNSPIYAGLERISNLQQAVARLGMRETRNILQVVIAQNVFQTAVKRLAKMMRDLWIHSLSTAYANEVIAQRLEIRDSRDYFMIGLIHDIGKLLIIHLIEIGRQRGHWGEEVITDEIVLKLMAMRHHDLGARLLEKWYYPTSFQEVVRLHNDDDNIQRRSEPVVATYFANLLTRKAGYSLVPHEPGLLDNRELANALNMTDQMRDDIEKSIADVTERIRQSCLVNN